MTTAHNSLVPVPRRPLTEEEHNWVRDIISANPVWADVSLGELYVNQQCTCGCRSVVFEEPAFVQNPRVSNQQNLVGEIDIHVRLESGKDDYVSVLLHHSWGKLTYLEVIWYNFPEPVPARWIELGREVRVVGADGKAYSRYALTLMYARPGKSGRWPTWWLAHLYVLCKGGNSCSGVTIGSHSWVGEQ